MIRVGSVSFPGKGCLSQGNGTSCLWKRYQNNGTGAAAMAQGQLLWNWGELPLYSRNKGRGTAGQKQWLRTKGHSR
eukprot:170882-Chlamydomonas_euryale.AAC.1